MASAVRGRAAIIGGSIAGLASAIGLARRGWEAVVVERDLSPETNDTDEAFLTWDRRNVPQFRQPHAFSSRSRNLLLAHVPEAVDWLVARGVEESNLFKLLAPPELHTPDDDAFTGLWTRRPGFELAIRRVAEAEPGVTIHCPAQVAGLLTKGPNGSATPHISGVRLSDGTTVDADVVLDCAGRRSPVPKWLGALGVEVPFDVQDCDSDYLTRYYRANSDAPLPRLALFGLAAQIDRMNFVAFAGDFNTYGIAAFVLPDDEDAKSLRHTWAWDAVVPHVGRLTAWVDPANATPITDVLFMGGHQNTRRYYVVDGRPVAHGLLNVGDSLCTTNPQYGWGASMALTHAFAAVQAADSHVGDPDAMALAYDEAVRDEADGVYRESAAADRARSYRWRGVEVPDWDREEMDRQELVGCVAAGATKDPVLGRAFLRRTNLLDSPASLLDDPLVVERAKNTQEILAGKAARKMGPDRDELREILDGARGVTESASVAT